jgi:hypothetical protein
VRTFCNAYEELRYAKAETQRGPSASPATTNPREPRIEQGGFGPLRHSRGWGRRRISPEFAEEVAEWLSSAGVTLFFAGSTYAVVKTSVVESWPRVTSKRLSADLQKVAQGTFDFDTLEPLLAAPEQDDGDDEA